MESPQPERRSKRLRRALKIVAIQLVLWPLLAIGAEFAMRAILRLEGARFSRDAAKAEIEKIRAEGRGFAPNAALGLPWNGDEADDAQRVLHPYLGFELLGGLKQLDDELHKLRGALDPKPYVVVILGGSVAEMFGSLGVAKLGATLSSDPRFAGKLLHFLPLGRGGYREPQQQSYLAYLLALGIPIDAVIDLDGFNEVAIGNQNGTFGAHASFPSIPHWSHLAARGNEDTAALDLAAQIREVQRDIDAEASRALAWRVEKSAVASKLALLRLHSLQGREAELGDRYTQRLRNPAMRRALTGPRIADDAKDPIAASVRIWSECSTNLRALCDGRGIRYLHVLQPTLHDPGSKPVSDEERKTGAIADEWRVGVERGYPMLRDEGAKLALAGEAFCDATRVFADVKETLYVDACHFNPRGNEILGEFIGKSFLAATPEAR